MLSNLSESFRTSPHRDIIASDNVSYKVLMSHIRRDTYYKVLMSHIRRDTYYKVLMSHIRRDTYCMGFPSEALYIITPDTLTSP
ncbi:hypothetical protein [Frog virus 3]